MRLLSFWRTGASRGVWILLLLLITGTAAAQPSHPMQRSGRDFTFGVIEGTELLPGSDQSSAHLAVTILAANDTVTEGCGTLISPSGFATDFSFTGKAPTVIKLPYSLVHLGDNGKTQKGLILHTNEPVTARVHDYMASAGDATQLYPNMSLDTDYYCPSWGLWNDNGEANHSEILVTAAYDNTLVTITPKVQTIVGQPADTPIHVTLNAGECYIIKADTTHGGSVMGLSGSTVLSSRPVSVIVGTTCAYVPLAVQSCNEMMDEIQGRSHWSDHFYVSPLGNADSAKNVIAILTSDKGFFFSVNGALNSAPDGRFELSTLSGAAEIRTFGTKCELHEIAVGSGLAYFGLSDPTLVTILDTTDWTDTVVWNTVVFPGAPDSTPFQSGTLHEAHEWVSLVYPAAADNVAKLDGVPLSSYGQGDVINSSQMMSQVIQVPAGRHKITSPLPLFAIATGFSQADAYTFIPGNTAPYVQRDTARHTIAVSIDSAMACHEFGATYSVEPPFDASEHVMSLTVTIAFDPTRTPVVEFEKHLLAENAFWSIDSITPGYLTVNIVGNSAITGNDLFRVLFRGAHKTATASITHGATACADNVEVLTTIPAQFRILASTDTLRQNLSFDTTPAILCKQFVVHLLSDSVISGEFLPDSIDISFDTTLFEFTSASLAGTLRGLPSMIKGGANGHLTITFDPISDASGSDSLLTLILLPRAGSQNAQIKARIFYHVCEDMHERDVLIAKQVTPNTDTTSTHLALTAPSVSFGNHAFVPVQLSGLPAVANVTNFLLYVTYDHGLLSQIAPTVTSTLTAGWTATVRTGASTDTVLFTAAPAPLGISGPLVTLVFETFIADTTASPIVVTSSLPAAIGGCEVLFNSKPALANFIGANLCGDSLMRSFMLTGQLLIERIEQISQSQLKLLLNSPDAEDLTISVSDVLGHKIQSNTEHVTNGKQSVSIDLGDLPSGTYLVEVQTKNGLFARKIIILR